MARKAKTNITEETQELDENIENNDCVDSESVDDASEVCNSDMAAELKRVTEYAQRVSADMENMKKRNKNIASDMYNEGKKDVVLKLLPVLDNMERAFSIEMDESVKTGLMNVVKMFVETLEKLSVTEIEALGKELDPNLHNVLMQVDDEENSGKIVNVFEKGYMLGDKVLRHASVVVAK